MRFRMPPRPLWDIPMTAMIDVVFLLLVFFVWTSSFRPEELLLPGSVATAAGLGPAATELAVPVELDPVIVRIRTAGDGWRWIVNGRTVRAADQLQSLLDEVTSITADVPLIVDPDDDIPLAEAVRVYDAARDAGLQRVHFAVTPE